MKWPFPWRRKIRLTADRAKFIRQFGAAHDRAARVGDVLSGILTVNEARALLGMNERLG